MKIFFKFLVRLLIIFVIVLLCLFLFYEYFDNGTTSPSKSLIPETDEHVLGVKYGSPSTYPDITYAEAFESFFGSPKWKFFRGKTDTSSTYVDVVEFTGSCIYRDVDVDARIQFTLSDDGKTFDATYLSFNEVPQSNLILYSLIDKAFSEYQEQKIMSSREVKPIG